MVVRFQFWEKKIRIRIFWNGCSSDATPIPEDTNPDFSTQNLLFVLTSAQKRFSFEKKWTEKAMVFCYQNCSDLL